MTNNETEPASHFSVHVFEEHSSTLPVWWQYKEENLTAVYLDAHLDLQQISEQRLNLLKACPDVASVAALEAPNHLDIRANYVYGIENFLHAAADLALIKRLVWVAPPHIPRTLSNALFAFTQKMEGVTFEEMTSFKPLGSSAMRGQLLGLDITVCHFDDLENLEIEPRYLLDIDIDYFVQVPEDRLWAEPGIVLNHIIAALGTPAVATISRAVSSGFTPLKLRFIADYLASILIKDADKVTRYRVLCDATIKYDQGKHEESAEIARRLVKTSNDCAASAFLLSLASQDNRESRDMHTHAATVDEAYAYNFTREVCGYPHRRRPVTDRSLENVEEVAGDLRENGVTEPYGDIALAQFYAWARRPDACWKVIEQHTDQIGRFAMSVLAVASNILTGPEPHKAVPLLKVAMGQDKTRMEATLYLADLAMGNRQYADAAVLYKQTASIAPAWLTPKERLIRCYEKMDNDGEKRSLELLVNNQKQRLREITAAATS